jgi:hypothetical protein
MVLGSALSVALALRFAIRKQALAILFRDEHGVRRVMLLRESSTSFRDQLRENVGRRDELGANSKTAPDAFGAFVGVFGGFDRQFQFGAQSLMTLAVVVLPAILVA